MDIIQTAALPSGLILEMEKRPNGYGVALFDPVAQDWRKVWPSESRIAACARFHVLRLTRTS